MHILYMEHVVGGQVGPQKTYLSVLADVYVVNAGVCARAVLFSPWVCVC